MATRNLIFLRILRDAELPMTIFESGDFAADINEVLAATNSVERYKRRWRLSKPVEQASGSVLTGKLGFERLGQIEAAIYDENRQDFVNFEERSQMGSFVHYVLHYESQYMVVEIKPPDIKPESVRGALRGLVRENPYGHGFEIDFVSNGQAFTDWLSSVSQVSTFKVSLRRPNPDFSDRPREIRELLEQSNAARVSIDARSARDESLEIEASLFGAYAEYATDEHGRVQARGFGEDTPSSYDSDRHRLSEAVDFSEKESSKEVFGTLIAAVLSVLSIRRG